MFAMHRSAVVERHGEHGTKHLLGEPARRGHVADEARPT
jgi:hypothetical protein